MLTVEPGLYFQPDDELVPDELRGIGVRIEDDVLVTATGARNLSAGLPRTPGRRARPGWPRSGRPVPACPARSVQLPGSSAPRRPRETAITRADASIKGWGTSRRVGRWGPQWPGADIGRGIHAPQLEQTATHLGS